MSNQPSTHAPSRHKQVHHGISIGTRQSIDDLLARWDHNRWEKACAEMQLRIAHGNYESAHAVLRRFCREAIPEFATMQSSVAELFPSRLAHTLQRAGYENLFAVSKAKDEELLLVRGLGVKAVAMIRQVIADTIAGSRLAIADDFDKEEIGCD